MRHIVAFSGGKDSTAMMLRLAEVEPRDNYEYVITPTGDELPEVYEHWNKTAEMLDKRLTLLTSGKSLQGLIRDWKALPNWRQRWCTRVLKIEPFNAFLLNARPAVTYVGLRADEESRKGIQLGNVFGVIQRYPLKEWGWGLSEVWDYLDSKGIEIPVRTDCARCFFQRLPEWYNLWKERPELYKDAEADEALTGYTFRSPSRDTWPAGLAELRLEFEGGRMPKGAGSPTSMDDRRRMCTTCKL